jgi:hypothetical protein
MRVIGQRLPAQLQGWAYSLMGDAFPVDHNHLHAAAAVRPLTCQLIVRSRHLVTSQVTHTIQTSIV